MHSTRVVIQEYLHLPWDTRHRQLGDLRARGVYAIPMWNTKAAVFALLFQQMVIHASWTEYTRIPAETQNICFRITTVREDLSSL